MQLLRQRGALDGNEPDNREALLLRVQELHGRVDPAPGEHHRGARPREASPGTRPRPSRSDSNEPGSTFICRVDAGPFRPCSSPYTLPPLSNGAHIFYVKAIDAPGNESQIVSRSFTVDTQPRGAQITDSDPNSPANDNAPKLKGFRRGRLDREAVQDGGLHAGTARGPGLGRHLRLARHHRRGRPTTRRRPSAPGRQTPPATPRRARALLHYVEDSTPEGLRA